jgi:hypothetical protein
MGGRSMSRSPEYVIVDGVAYPKAGTFVRDEKSEHFSGDNFRSENYPEQIPAGRQRSMRRHIDSAAGYDPHQLHREFPERWSTYIRSNFRSLAHVTQVFPVSERTARSWWKGETGANGANVAIAVNEHPVAAPRILFAAE